MKTLPAWMQGKPLHAGTPGSIGWSIAPSPAADDLVAVGGLTQGAQHMTVHASFPPLDQFLEPG
eukprot:5303026-Prorocentrum_lima.AAC.1